MPTKPNATSSTSSVESRESELTGGLKNKLNEIAFSNNNIKKLMQENMSLRQQLGNRGKSANRRQASAGSSIPALQRLGSSPDLPKGYQRSK